MKTATLRAACTLLLLLLVAAPAAAQKKIVIDPGHGGTDPGGTGNGLQEKNIVLDVSKRFQDLLNADTADANGGGSWTVSMTRDTDVFISLSARANFANARGADRFMSMHSNAFGDPQANGTETFSYSGTGAGANLRNLVQEEMIRAWGLTNRGNKTANFAVLRQTAMPAELHELAFVTNTTDAAKLASPGERQKAAEAHLRAIQRHYNHAPYIPGQAPDPTFGALEVRVVSVDGPVAGAQVSVDGDERGTTDGDGLLRVEKLSPGSHLASAVADGFTASDQEVAVEPDATTAVELVLTASTTEPDPKEDNCDSEEGCEEDSDVAGGCSLSSSTPGPWSALLALLLVGYRRRRRS